MNRRKLLRAALSGAATGALVSSKVLASEACKAVGPTVSQTEGPFYPADWKEYEADADMTTITGSNEYAKGQVVILTGRVVDLDCNPIRNATVDVWQANIFGQYFHKNDAEFENLKDKHFQYRSKLTTGRDGDFSVKTIKPSAYFVTDGWYRPPHIHYKVEASGYKTLTTQMYFEGDPLNEEDRIINSMSETQKNGVIVSFEENEEKVLIGNFDIVIESLENL